MSTDSDEKIKESTEVESINSVEPSEAVSENEAQEGGLVEKILNYGLTILIVSLAIFIGYVMICTAKGKAASVFGRNVLRVVTGSMEPTILTNDYIITRKTDVESLKPGDIIAFYSEDPTILEKLVIHRIVSVNEDGSFVVKGDANPINDRYSVKPEKILGKYTGKARLFNWVNSFADARKLLLLFVIIPILLITVYELKSMKKLVKMMKEQEDKKKAFESLSGAEKDEIKKKELESRIEQLKREAVEKYIAEHEGEANKPEEKNENS